MPDVTLAPTSPRHARALEALAKIPHFGSLPEQVREAIADAAVPHEFAAGQVIYLEGEPGSTVYLLETGWVRAVRTSPEGREQALLFLRPGELFGDIAVLTDQSYPGTVVALEDVRAWAIDGPVFLELLGRYPELSLAVIRRLAERVAYFIGLVEDLSLRTVEARLAATLLRHAEAHQDELVVPRREWTTFDEMARRLGTVRDVLSRALHTLEQEGLLRVERRRIVLLDPAGLELRGRS